jgi:DNA-binding YbaB/EbfC family protein
MVKQLIEAEAGDGAVIVTVNGEMKVKKVKINPEMVDTNNIEQLEKWIEDALRGATNAAQEYAAEKMKPIMGNLGGMGF